MKYVTRLSIMIDVCTKFEVDPPNTKELTESTCFHLQITHFHRYLPPNIAATRISLTENPILRRHTRKN